ncbi:BamA/OMP85 family outer membrane protein [Rubricoccus marinus]|uniref:Bacterial surface antigen (D15) domain-containing protein n=1 Tax=Rubricoccus marinus TaxID=716817 RepID=A0A259TVN0_9BACT|nr:BamA/TamA family outer membrane protein [Rubricoccus marinus]OZC01781.1 hypothetical protein BSZ36_01530 [Rubricoccus marinus]
MPFSRLSFVAAFVVGLVASGAAAQEGAPLVFVNDDTQVSALSFEAVDGSLTLDPASLELQVATTAPTFFEKAPWRYLSPGAPPPHPLNPIELQKDVVRLQRYYERNGFPRSLVDYTVDLDTARNAAGVTFQIAEGPPLVLEGVEFGKPSAPPVTESLMPELREEWLDYVETLGLQTGERLTEFSLVSLQNRTRQWLRTRSYAWADVSYERFIDSTGLAATVRLKVSPGPPTTYGEIVIERVDSTAQANITDNVILRELPFRPGDPFDAGDLAVGQREIFGLGVFQLATVDVEPQSPPYDSTATIIVRVREAPLRVLRAFGGYFTEGGVTGRLEATHRNAFGGARNATATIEARTGILDQSNVVDGLYDYRASLALRQPYVGYRALSYTLTPAVRSRNDEIERSVSASLTNTLLFTRSTLQTAAVNASFQNRRVDPFGTATNGFFDLRNILQGDSTLAVTTTAVGVDVTAGFVDNPLQPRSGVILRPSARVATPLATDYQYARGALSASAFYPFGDRTGLTAKGTVGAFSTYGGTTLSNPIAYVLLRDQYFYGGGATDVRGWAVTQLGPKVINFRIADVLGSRGEVTRQDTTVTGYAGIGGTRKLFGSVQLNLPFFLGPQWGSNVFVDAGMISAAADFDLDEAFGASQATEDLEDILRNEGGLRVATGAGLQYLTPIGFVGFALGVKLNPSYFDLRNPEQIFCGPTDARGAVPDDSGALFCDAGFADAARNGQAFDFEGVAPSKGFFGLIPQARRLQLQITFGQSF